MAHYVVVLLTFISHGFTAQLMFPSNRCGFKTCNICNLVLLWVFCLVIDMLRLFPLESVCDTMRCLSLNWGMNKKGRYPLFYESSCQG